MSFVQVPGKSPDSLAAHSSAGTSVAIHFDNMAERVVEAAEALEIATLCLRSTETVNNPNQADFRKLKQCVLREANAYRAAVFPVAQESVEAAKFFMEKFIDLTNEQVKNIGQAIMAGADGVHDLMKICSDMHKEMNCCFKTHQDQMDGILSKFRLEVEHLEKQQEEFQKAGQTKMAWAIGLSFIPVVAVFAAPILKTKADDDFRRVIAAQEEVQLIVNATHALRNVLARALDKYVLAMGTFASSFKLMAGEVKGFMKNLDDYQETEQDEFLHLCHVKGKVVQKACEIYMSKTTSIETNLMALPGTEEENYVQKWLAEHNAGEQKSFKERLTAMGKSLSKDLRQLCQGGF